ncbi:hypothetical protein FDK12_05675 [Arthrobacter sp. NamB2]|uniref:hypothetical protein n=1 Tax=Arthrobacter sp. NamB2 TaxID=2576035 RepID=UPI0010C9ECB3|nr:hypothetical protein [Arthrobacter sp. NamB2]TKV29135.1 hypothetical protein FDK12_05675 [Arthrobacter sp. NamB2]
MNTRLTSSEPFPEDLGGLDLPEVEVLNSKIQRELAHAYVHDGEVDPETEFRSEELIQELDRRDAAATAPSAVSPQAFLPAGGDVRHL